MRTIPLAIGRRGFLAGLSASALLALPGCASTGALSFTEAIRRLLALSTQNAFAGLTTEGGFYDNTLVRLDLPDVLGSRGNTVQNILTSAVFKNRLQKEFNHMAEDGARRAAPVVADTVRTIGIENAVALVKGGPTAATDFLRGAMAGSLVEVMVPALGDAIRLSNDPLVGQVISALTGIDASGVARDLAGDVDNAIWKAVAQEESAIRADPSRTKDPLLMGVFGVL
ncbi:DUF4197 domain-containing protein [Tsuneonella sp. CC-YZS046]|uniref:DUF4197 domain-containing protein n=1 Tax=Tsuneonella sp. CC-YZS046 TaxID=3042152 RepID=UPI002D78862B|nr:DUF4197 domain-containing protein [Tsuneonella sp. CC-YZS046]WRO65092.1 DUF4197 domain-containing protein [Tsuneonella sp. CC-YZS046]